MQIGTRKVGGISLCMILLASIATFGFGNMEKAAAEPFIKLSSTKAPAGSVVTVSGWGFTNNTLTNIYFNDEFLGGTTTSGSGTFSRVVTIPTTATLGTHRIITSDNVNITDAEFTVTDPAIINISPNAGIPGKAVTVKGTNFGVNENIFVMFNGIMIETVPSNLLSSATGTFEATIYIPSVEAARYAITASNGIFGASAMFDVRHSATIMLSADSGPTGTVIEVKGSGFSPSTHITLKFDSTRLATTPSEIKTTPEGTFSALITIPIGIATGVGTITAIDSFDKTGSALFNVNESSSVMLSPTTGYSGSSINISGSGFSSNSIVTIKMGSEVLVTKPPTVKTGESGTFAATLTLPYTADTGAHKITVTDASGRNSSALLNISGPGPLSLSRASGVAGTNVTVVGMGFSPDSIVTMRFGSNSLNSLKTDSQGNFKTTVTIPEDAPVGKYDISVRDEFGRASNSTFTVMVAGKITISPSKGPPGTEVTITGARFVNGTNVEIKFNELNVETFPPVIVNGRVGNFVAKFRVPDVESGTYAVYAEDSFGVLATAMFTVKQDGLSLEVSQISNRGGLVEVMGEGFPPSSPVTIIFNGEPIITNPPKVNASRTGTFTASFIIPGTLANGSYEISASSNDVVATTTLELKRQYIDDRYGILISIVPEKYDFDVGETLTISGRVLALNNNFPLILKIITPANAACNFQQLYLNEDMTFTAQPVKLEGPLCSVEGEYKITAFYGKGKSLTKFRVAGYDDELTGGKASVINAHWIEEILRYDNKYTVDLDWATNAVLLRNNVNQTISFYLMFVEFDANEFTKNLSYQEVTLAPYERSYVVAPYVPQMKDGRPDGYLHVFAWSSMTEPKPLHPGLYIPY